MRRWVEPARNSAALKNPRVDSRTGRAPVVYPEGSERLVADGICGRRGCGEPATRKWSHSFFCLRHYRFNKMRALANRRRVVVPTLERLEEMWPRDMKCPHCRRDVVWSAGPGAGRGSVLSLQHDHGGTIRMLCQSCNSRHRDVPNDGFYAIPPGSRYCRPCNTVKLLTAFSKRTKCCKQCHYNRELLLKRRRKAAMEGAHATA